MELYTKEIIDEAQLRTMNTRLRQRRAAVQTQLDTVSPLPVDFQVNPDRVRAFLDQMEQWMREGDVLRRKTLLREVYQEIRLWPKTGSKSWTRKVSVAANLDALTRAFVVAPTGFEPVFRP